jgi:hypothetical protein
MADRTHDKTWPLIPLIDSRAEEPPAWELLEAGRYMPRRIRGSYRGRELG